MSKKELREQRKAEQRDQQRKMESASRAKTMRIVLGVVAVLAIVITVLIVRGPKGNLEAGTSPDPVKGNPAAAVKVTLYEDFQCPACQAFTPFVQAAAEEFGDAIAIEFNDFPLTTIHPNAMISSEAAQCAFDQDKFWEYHDTLYREQRIWSEQSDPRDQLIAYATELELNVETFTNCLDNGDTTARVKEDMREATQAKVNSTPTVFINGERYVNDGNYETFANTIREALAESSNAATQSTNQ